MPASPSASASCATIPGRLGTATRSSLTGPPARSASSRRWRSARAPSIQRSSRAGSPARRSSRTSCERGEVGVQLALERLAVRQEDVAPQRRVRARHARRVAEARAGRRQALRLVGQLARGLAHQHVREHVRQVADGRHQAVVHVGRDRGRPRAERRHEPVEALVQTCRWSARSGVRYQVASSNRSARACVDARCLGAGQRMSADEPLAVGDAVGRPPASPSRRRSRRSRRACSSASAASAGSAETGAHTKHASAPSTRLGHRPAARSIAPRSSARASAPSSGS